MINLHAAVQHERGPRNSTLRRQMSLFYSPRSPTARSSGGNGGGDSSAERSGGGNTSSSSTPSPTPLTPPASFRADPTTNSMTTTPPAAFHMPNIITPPPAPAAIPAPFHMSAPAMSLADRMALLTSRAGLLCAPQAKYPHEIMQQQQREQREREQLQLGCNFTPETICESAARLLFMNVRWAKSVPAFTALPPRDQVN